MATRGRHRLALIEAALRLFQRRGYAATGLADILTVSDAPKGSLYHYFPGGKEEIAAAAVAAAGARVSGTLRQLAEETGDGAAFVRAYGGLLAGWMKKSKFKDGCPIATVLLETAPDAKEITARGRESLRDWTAITAAKLEADGLGTDDAHALATLVVSGLEGALVLARTEQSARPIETVTERLARLVASNP